MITEQLVIFLIVISKRLHIKYMNLCIVETKTMH